MRLGIVTYDIAKDWDLATIIRVCEEVGLQGVELRTTHAHEVETNLTLKERKKVRSAFENSSVELVGLGSVFEYHSPDPRILQGNINGTKEYVRLAADVGAQGVKVRPNDLPDEIPVEKSIEQIGLALREVSDFAEHYKIKIRLEVHGRRSAHVPYIRRMLDIADHDNLYVCWNSNLEEVEGGSIERNFKLLRDEIDLVHISELYVEKYPWKELFELLKESNYEGFTLAEIPSCQDIKTATRLLKYYRALWLELNR
jgi:sugar phosphate isomerase/epimerase